MKKKPHYHDHRKRLRERFERGGERALQNYEILELLLTYAIPRKDVKPVAKELIDTFGSLAGVLDADGEKLASVSGIGPRSAALIPLVKELCASYMTEKMRGRDLLGSPHAVVNFARLKLAGSANEQFMVIFLNVKNELIEFETMYEGTIDRAVVYPRRVMESALAHHAAGIILVHNHPSGHPDPSAEDKSITRAIAEAGRGLDIRVLDHVVVGGDGYYSFAEQNIL